MATANKAQLAQQLKQIKRTSQGKPRVKQTLLRSALVFNLIISLMGATFLSACTGGGGGSGSGNNGSATGGVTVRIASLRGATSIGLVDLMQKSEQTTGGFGDTGFKYDFQIKGTADEILPQLISGDLDIALLPANVASVLYNRTEGGITVLNINTLGVLYVVSADESVDSIASLSGRTLLTTGKGTTPDFVMSYLLQQNGLTDLVTLDYRSESTELAAILNSDPTAIALLPEPYVSAVCARNPDLQPRISLTDEWRSVSAGGQLVTGVTVVRTEFLAQHPDVIETFLAQHADSVNAANADPATTAELVVQYGIIDNAAVVEQAIPRCYMVSITGEDMRTALSMYLEVLHDANPESIGGKLPGDDFYYIP